MTFSLAARAKVFSESRRSLPIFGRQGGPNEFLQDIKIRMGFRDQPLENRLAESTRLRARHPDKVPIICEPSEEIEDSLTLDRSRFLCPGKLQFPFFEPCKSI